MTKEEWLALRDSFDQMPDKAFESLFDNLWEQLYSAAFRYVRDQSIAEEIVQDVFVSFWLKRSQLSAVLDITPFAIRAVHNLVYNHFDKQSIRQQYLLNVSKSGIRTVDSTQQHVEFNETLSLINAEIEKLPDTTQQIFRLSRFDRFSNEEIASRLQLSVKSVEYHVTQALKHLRLRLKYTGIITLILFTVS